MLNNQNQPEPKALNEVNDADLSGASLTPAPEQENAPQRNLAEKIAGLIRDVSDKLAAGPLTRREYSNAIFDSAKAQGILSGEFDFDNAGRVGHLVYQLRKKLGVQDLQGINYEYNSLPNVALTDPVKSDLAAFEKMSEAVGRGLHAQIGSRRIAEEDFKDLAKKEVDTWLAQNQPADCEARTNSFCRAGLYGNMIGTYKRDFDVYKPKENGFSGFDSDDLDQAFGDA